MRRLILIAAMAAAIQIPVAYAQQEAHPKAAVGASASGIADDQNNCGTPTDYKACPPLPSHPLQEYRPH